MSLQALGLCHSLTRGKGTEFLWHLLLLRKTLSSPVTLWGSLVHLHLPAHQVKIFFIVFFFYNLLLPSVNKWQYSIRNILISSESNGHYQASGPGSDASQSHLWKTQSIPASGALLHYGSKRAAPGPAVRHCTPLSHPYKAGDRYASWAHVSLVFAACCASGLKPNMWELMCFQFTALRWEHTANQ